MLAVSALGADGQQAGADSAQATARPTPADTYADPEVRGLLERGRAALGSGAAGIDHYEALLQERIYVGLSALRFRRERAVFTQRRAARVRWEASGDQIVQWLGTRQAVPIVGDRADVQAELDRDIHEELALGGDLGPVRLDPGGERLSIAEDGDAVHPLADTAVFHYRFASGDTLRLRLPVGDRVVTVAEVRVAPRRSDISLLAGSLWFDLESAALVRATYKPARPFDLEVDEPEDADDVPGFLKPITAEVEYITVDYGLYDLRWWLPRRFAFEGEARMGRLARVPITVEWSLGEYRLNESDSEILTPDGRLPVGWFRTEELVRQGDREVAVTVLTPPQDSLRAYAGTELETLTGEPSAFTEGELGEIRDGLEELIPTAGFGAPRFAYGLEDGNLRYNRVEGLSLGANGRLPLGRGWRLSLGGRVGVADFELGAELGLENGDDAGGLSLRGYRRLDHASDWDDPFDLASSLSSLVFGDDRGQYFRTEGAELEWRGSSRRSVGSLRVFGERQSAVRRETSFYLLEPLTDDRVGDNIHADEGSVVGLSGEARTHRGTDPDRLILFGAARGDVVVGDHHYRRLRASVGLTHPIVFGAVAGLELGAGHAWGGVPVQRRFYLGGSSTLRGFQTGTVVGRSYWTARAELGSNFPAARITAFVDGGQAADGFEGFSIDRTLLAVGIGGSLLDGLVRADLARALRGGNEFRLHVYVDGIF